MADIARDPLIESFLQEAEELLAAYESGLLALEENPDDTEALHRIFRTAHTLKGNAAMLGFDDITRVAHALEDLLDQLRKGQRSANQLVIDILLAAGDTITTLVDRARQDAAPSASDVASAESIREALRGLLAQEGARPAAPPASAVSDGDHGVPVAAPAAAPADDASRRWQIAFHPPGDLFARGLDPFQLLEQVAELGTIVEAAADLDELPALADMDPERCYLGWRLVVDSSRSADELAACFEFVADPSAVAISPLSTSPLEPAHAPVEAPGGTDAGGPPRPRVPAAVAAAESRRTGGAATEHASIRVPIAKVDRLINLVGELVITQSMVAQGLSRVADAHGGTLAALEEAVGQMDRHARELHEHVLAIRMVPIKSLFARFPRLVRDLAAASEKQAVLEVAGEDTELDKTVIERIGDPLTHLIRNAIDHGLETPAERRAAAKPTAGTVRMEAYQQGGAIYIDVSDDGKGLDRERVLQKAIDQGLVAPGQTVTDEEVFGLIFRPGLSTAARITEISGRGVGMDVVKRNVEELGGKISIQSERGRGTRFRIKLPLTLAIMDGQALEVGDQIYILPLVSITETVRPAPGSVRELPGGEEVVTVRGDALPMIRLHRLFGLEPRHQDPTRSLVVIVEHEGRLCALLVDELLGQQQVVIKSLETEFQRAGGIAGATILGDGRVALILDVSGLVAAHRTHHRAAA